MADFRLLYPTDYIAAHDLRGKDVTKTIKSVVIEELRLTGGGKEKKPVLTFSDSKKRLVMNKTNAKTIASLYGNDTNGWVGKKIALYPTTTMFGRNTVDCVRIRERGVQAAEAVPADEHPFEIESGRVDPETGEVDMMDAEPGANDAP